MVKEDLSCHGKFPMWTFSGSKCFEFTYGGCKGNNNKFKSKEECELICLSYMQHGAKDAKGLTGDLLDKTNAKPKSSLMAKLSQLGLTAKKKSKLAKSAESTKPKNAKLDQAKALKSSKAKIGKHGEMPPAASSKSTHSVEDCGLEPAKNGNGKMTCLALHERFTYYPAKQSCHKFNYGGCGGNRNSFETKEECEDVCRDFKPPHAVSPPKEEPKRPKRPKKPKKPERPIPMPFMESRKTNSVGKSGGSEKKQVGGKAKVQQVEDDPCQDAPGESGVYGDDCSYPVIQWTYDPAEGECVAFNYFGCKGNRNRFDTPVECETTCDADYVANDASLTKPRHERPPSIMDFKEKPEGV
jgi:hypothetical protein